jgi:hypothetical protein
MNPYLVLATGFALVGTAMVAVEAMARAGRGPFRTVGEAWHTALRVRVGRWGSAGRWLTMLGWLWLGFHFLAR